MLDIGAREGHFCVELARRFGFAVHGIEPVRRHLDNAARALGALTVAEPGVAARIRIDYGVAERLPGPDASADLIWCRDVLEHVQNLEAAFREFRRVLPAYEERFGTDAYEAMLTGSLWGVYQMIGKLNPRLYVLSA